ncbi:MAG: hypothetical protein KDD42_08685, partial [Bdellovibrionales bacterium]|nr:hypothetical protein [Bdellovibrionales bacterium]
DSGNLRLLRRDLGITRVLVQSGRNQCDLSDVANFESRLSEASTKADRVLGIAGRDGRWVLEAISGDFDEIQKYANTLRWDGDITTVTEFDLTMELSLVDQVKSNLQAAIGIREESESDRRSYREMEP